MLIIHLSLFDLNFLLGTRAHTHAHMDAYMHTHTLTPTNTCTHAHLHKVKKLLMTLQNIAKQA